MIERLIPQPKLRILELLRAHGPQAVWEIAGELGITESGARQHMTNLQKVGLVDVKVVRRGPGRPSHLYALHPRAKLELGFVWEVTDA
jgi:predicted ArsR family transcriptional regulator